MFVAAKLIGLIVEFFGLFLDTIDTRCYFNVRSKADMSQLNLPHRA